MDKVAQMDRSDRADLFNETAALMGLHPAKDMFYHCGWAKYDSAVPGSFHLIPPQERLSAIKRDYCDMTAMFFNEPPEIEAIFHQLTILERRINHS